MKIGTVVGARPQFIKAAAVSRMLRAMPGVQEVPDSHRPALR
jgi:UDP-GlcNAc3NAcA epimerase